MRRRRIGQLLAFCLLAGVLTPLAGRPASAEAPVFWGAHPEVRSGENRETAYLRLQSTAGRHLDSVRQFYLWNEAWPTSYEARLKTDGTTLVMSVKSRLMNGTGVPWAEVAAAQPGSTRYNEMINWVRKVRDYGVPVWFTFNHEPEAAGNIDLGTATDYLAAWRRWVTLFQQEGATNVKFMWIMTDQSFWLASSDRRAAARWYPGDAYVDGIAVDAYNWYNCRPGINNAWKSLRDIINPARLFWLNHTGEQFWVTEYASAEDAAVPGRKAQWYRDAQALFKTPDFAVTDGVMQFEPPHPNSNCIWRPESSASALAAWQAWGQDSYYGGAATPPPPPASTAALVVGDAATLGADAGIADRLRARGYTVTVYDDDTVTATTVATSTLVLISQTTSSGALGTKLRSVSRPVLIWKPSLYNDMAMSPTEASSTSQTSIAITLPGHPLAAGRSGTVTILTSSTQLPVSDTAATATVVATVAGRASLFVYPAGTAMSGLTAPACRLAFPMQSGGIPRLTADGLALFDEAVDYAAAGCT
jgi:hypothetical protein